MAAETSSPWPRVAGRTVTRLSDWVSVTERDVRFHAGDGPHLYHSLRQADYVSVLARTPDGRVPLVRQFRPALESETLELPGGLRDGDEPPDLAAARELLEETGHASAQALVPLGRLCPDTGRLENALWGFFAVDVRPVVGWTREPTVAVEMMPDADLKAAAIDGRMTHALHIALVGMAALRGLI
jgi:ADP-ribose pyrophosphatase